MILFMGFLTLCALSSAKKAQEFDLSNCTITICTAGKNIALNNHVDQKEARSAIYPILEQIKQKSSNLNSVNYSKIALAAAALGYSYLFAELLRCKSYISNPDCWSSFEAETGLLDLATGNQTELLDRLMLAISMRYRVSYPTIVEQLNAFMQDTNRELSYLRTFIARYQMLEYAHMALIFPGNETDLARANEQIDRLRLLQKLVCTHLITQSVSKFNRAISMLDESAL